MELFSSGEKEGLGYRITFELVGQSGTGVFVSFCLGKKRDSNYFGWKIASCCRFSVFVSFGLCVYAC